MAMWVGGIKEKHRFEKHLCTLGVLNVSSFYNILNLRGSVTHTDKIIKTIPAARLCIIHFGSEVGCGAAARTHTEQVKALYPEQLAD
jgi:hypothetical protein